MKINRIETDRYEVLLDGLRKGYVRKRLVERTEHSGYVSHHGENNTCYSIRPVYDALDLDEHPVCDYSYRTLREAATLLARGVRA